MVLCLLRWLTTLVGGGGLFCFGSPTISESKRFRVVCVRDVVFHDGVGLMMMMTLFLLEVSLALAPAVKGGVAAAVLYGGGCGGNGLVAFGCIFFWGFSIGVVLVLVFLARFCRKRGFGVAVSDLIGRRQF
jgi:hypothetical protein